MNDEQILASFYKQNKKNMSVYEQKICLGIISNFKEIAGTSFHMGRRQKLIVEIINPKNEYEYTSDLVENSDDNKTENIKQLTSLSVGDFRGFQDRQYFTFGSKFTFIYGANGTGKSSLVDALEYALSGNIQESSFKRIDVNEYIQNIFTKSEKQLELKGITDKGKETKIRANNEKYSFAIIERNRIDNFSRLSAESINIKKSRLAALVGLDTWLKFVSDFSQNIDKYIDDLLLPMYETGLKLNSDQLDKLNEQLIDATTQAQIYEKKVKEITEKYSLNKDSDFKSQLNTIYDKKIKENEKTNKIKNIPQNIFSDFIKAYKSYFETLNKIKNKTSKLVDYKDALSLTELANAVLLKEEAYPNTCPACLSPIYDDEDNLLVQVNPYDRSLEIKSKFLSAEELERSLQTDRKCLQKASLILLPILLNLKNIFDDNNIDLNSNFDDNNIDLNSKIQENIVLLQNNHISTKIMELNTCEIELMNQEIKKIQDQYSNSQQTIIQKQKEIAELNTDQGQLESISQFLFNEHNKIKNIKVKISTQKGYIKSIRSKQSKNSKNNELLQKYKSAYIELVKKIKEFTTKLTSKSLSNINDDTKIIYNKINKYDDSQELLENLTVPKSDEDVITISFKKNKTISVNALDVLSEGHIRVLGLSLLLAKAVEDKQSFIIFDDVVNAIDDDHRRAIAELITNEYDMFSDLQWIITTHGQQFAKQLASYAGLNKKQVIHEITFKTNKGNSGDVLSIDKSQNYLALASKKLEEEDIRGCLADCRRQVEVLMLKLVKLYKTRYKDDLSFQVDPARPVFNSHNVFQTVLSGLKDKLKSSPDELKIMEPLLELTEKIVDDKSPSMTWFLGNKGTHEEDLAEEFCRADADIILNDILKPLDNLLTNSITAKNRIFQNKQSK
ncbi:ATP-binding protein [Weissella hellenica]|uniref:ATP-binding protein n=1 Tax=Weissella hellenica TaxID=46256 RepID=UPI0038887A7A